MPRLEIPGTYLIDTQIRETPNASRAVLLLHGYGESGQRIFSKLEPQIPRDWAVLAPNGPFPVPLVFKYSRKLGFSWYFYDPETDEYFIDMRIAVEILVTLLEDRGFSRLPLTILGFSQGGYLAPFVAKRLPATDHVIGLGARFLDDEIPGEIPFRMDAVHGAQDERVSIHSSRESFNRLQARGVRGSFIELPDSGHRIDLAMKQAVSRLLRAR